MDLFAPSHLLVLLLIILIIFGPSKLGDVGGALGKAIKDFKRAMNDEPEAKPTRDLRRRLLRPGAVLARDAYHRVPHAGHTMRPVPDSQRTGPGRGVVRRAVRRAA